MASTFLIEKIKLEHVCDVCLAVRSIRHNRKQFVTSQVALLMTKYETPLTIYFIASFIFQEQFTFLYELAVSYTSKFQTYSNFAKPANRTVSNT